MRLNRITLTALTLCCSLVGFAGSDSAHAAARNPIIWADVPDIAIIRVGKTYYMSSTTMHMSPGLPIMKSADLVNWRMASYAYEILADNEALRLENGKNAYGLGSWASSLRYHDGVFHASTFSANTGRTHIYTTRDPERGPWKETSFAPSLGDHSLFFEDGRIYMVYGGGRITLIELKPDLSGIKPGGVNQVIVESVNALFGADQGGLKGEGSQLFKINGRYYLFNIASPGSRWARTVIVHRADAITGPYEGRIALDDRGIAQGGLIDTPEGKWYAYLFKDNDAVGRIPYLVPVTWKDGWPVLGENGKLPDTLNLPESKGLVPDIVASDDFDQQPGHPALSLVWQWNHTPDNKLWSITQRPGFLRLTTSGVVPDFVHARNSLTQRTFGPECSGSVSLDVSRMQDGDFAGLGLLQKNYGLVGVKMAGAAKSIVMISAAGTDGKSPDVLQSVPLTSRTVFLKLECDFRNQTDQGKFYYSLDGRKWTAIGAPVPMSYTAPHFMGYRFALFNYATKSSGGSVDFDYFHVSGKVDR
jgi:beta-xylosidase